ncbi:hypothetical protein H5J24_22210 [Chryseobacterium capnotolerans]|uniref:hypothetical protein n=1 Tax=Chryseobacterium TaxID=59732 RepID=UPI000B22FB70|nr:MULTISPECIES: hypothetical protein [Chryseobacterium]UHO38236.1 hypothetical protein H5J24_22210 [Chryseobacterium capnotolerans]
MENKATGVSVENTPSQTLFRFVSLRSPQLSDDTKNDNRFITIPNELKSDDAFYMPVVNGTGSKQRLLQACAANYANNPKCISSDLNNANNLNAFKIAYRAFYTFGAWLAKNKNKCTFQEFITKRNELFVAEIQPTPSRVDLWNNLIYQVVTQKDFYIKETVMQMVLAQYVLPISNEETMKKMLGARIVLPKELMMDEKSLPASNAASRMAAEGPQQTPPSEEMKKQQLISTAKVKLAKFEALKKSLSGLERKYRAEYQDAYKMREQEYQREIAPIIERYNAEVAANRERYCEIRKPEVKYDPTDPCQQLPMVPEPVLPPFDFNFRQEIEPELLLRALNSDDLDALLDILGFDFSKESGKERLAATGASSLDSLLDGRNTFSEITSLMNDAFEKSHNSIIQNTEADEEVYTSIGGVVVPMARTISIPFTYQICPKWIYKGYTFDMSLTVPDSSWDVQYISYTLTPKNGLPSITSDYYMKSRSGNTIFLNDLCMPGLDLNTVQDASLDINIQFTNGKKSGPYIPKLQARACLSDKFWLETEEEEPVVIDEDNTFIPSGFGFKQIGIADYLKVEQTTHAYVEGEVAHIENIMAREYREKSTRKLRRSENTTTKSTDKEREQLSDTTTANRFEMQSEVAKMMQESSDNNTQFGINANYDGGAYNINTSLGLGNAHHSSKDESTRQAVSQAQDVTSRAMDRIVTKVHEERIEKIIDEFEENNKHGFDNTKGDKHVVGVYRWVDKLMKNQIYNYGKRMMFEFMIPEPARLHILGKGQSKLVKPEDPRTSLTMTMANYTALANDTVFNFWAGKYNITAIKKLDPVIYISHAFSEKNIATDDAYGNGRWAGLYHNNEFKIPENYEAISVKGSLAGGGGVLFNGGTLYNKATTYICGVKQITDAVSMSLDAIRDKITISYNSWDMKGVTGSLVATCRLTQEAQTQWQQEAFNAIIQAYEQALAEYNNKLSEELNKAVEIKGSNPNFYRKIENTILRKNCISYMADRASGSTHGYGLSGLTEGSSFLDYETKLDKKLDRYTAFVKFMEQAFEWENLSYYLYPYYWGNKQNWETMYQAEDTDPLFGAFLQSGMARVIATVRPGFEDAVQFYLATGKIWNGGEVPVIGDELYLSIVDEMKEPKGIKQGKAWITRLPTTLNILQAESIGLKVGHALPFTAENPDDFEVPGEVITEDKFNFEKNDSVLGGNTSGEKWIQFTAKSFDRVGEFEFIENLDEKREFPRKYYCMGKEIVIDRDASWKPSSSTSVLYYALAEEVSKIDGIQAFPNVEDGFGLTFRIDINKIKHFKFVKPPYSELLDSVEVIVTDESLKFVNSFIISTSRLADKNGTNITQEEYSQNISLSRFLI